MTINAVIMYPILAAVIFGIGWMAHDMFKRPEDTNDESEYTDDAHDSWSVIVDTRGDYSTDSRNGGVRGISSENDSGTDEV